jgi:hypothetical protein
VISFLQDFVHQKWGDLCALFLIALGVEISIRSAQPQLGHDLVAAGLIGLKMTKTTAPTNYGSGASGPAQNPAGNPPATKG